MESAGLQRILALCQAFNVANIDKQIKSLQASLEEDEDKLRERLDQEILRDLNNPQDVYNAIFAKIDDTKARDHFLSMMQHLLLIREEGAPMVHYYQFLDSLVTDVVLDKKLSGAEQRFGHSVERIIAQFNESDRLQTVEEEMQKVRAEATRLKLEKDVLEEEVAQGGDGLIGQLKERLAHMEQKLNVSRETTARLQGQLETQKAGYEEQIAQLEAQIMELFRMLKELGTGVETILDSGTMDRKSLVQTLEKHFQRTQTINILEGRKGSGRRKKKSGFDDDSEDEEEDLDATPGKSSHKRPPKPGGPVPRSVSSSSRRIDPQADSRSSQFMDADEADADEQIQQQLSAGVAVVSTNPLACA